MKKTCNLISLLLALLLATGCNNTDVLSPHSQAANIAEEKFLDLTDIPSEDIEILTKANERIKPYVEVKNGLLVLTATSGKELKISDRLFRIFVRGIAENNRLIENGTLFVVDGELYPTDFSMNSFPRKRSIYETIEKGENYESVTEYDYWGQTQTTTYTNSDGALDYYEQHSHTTSIQLAVAGVISIGISVTFPPAVGALYTAACTAAGLIVSDVSSKIHTAARKGGITVKTITMPGDMPGDPPKTNTIIPARQQSRI